MPFFGVIELMDGKRPVKLHGAAALKFQRRRRVGCEVALLPKFA
jgi:hypothetical protein